MTDQQQQRRAELAAELGPEATRRAQAYIRQYMATAATLSWCPRCQDETETKTLAVSTFIQDQTCRACGCLKR